MTTDTTTITMSISINRNTLLDSLQLAVNISPKTTSDPIIHNLLIETISDNRISIKATNHENSVYGEFDANVQFPGSICVSTSKLFNLVREFRADLVQINATPQNWVYIICGNSKVKLPGVEPSQFPTVEFKNLEKEIILPPKILRNAIDRNIYAIGENESRKNLMGLNLQIVSGNEISWTGADSFRICQLNTVLEKEGLTEGNIIIPKKNLQEIKRVLEFSQDDVLLSFDDNIFQVFSGAIKYKTRLIEAEFPNLNRLVNRTSLYDVNISKQELLNAIKILSTITEGDQKSVVKVTFGTGQMTLESQKLEFGEGNDNIVCDYDGEPMSIGLNIKYFLDAVQAFDAAADENIILSIYNPETPFIIHCEEWDNYKSVLMPVRIKW